MWVSARRRVNRSSKRPNTSKSQDAVTQDQTVSWIRIVNGIDKFVREAMPIQEEEKASGKTCCKSKTDTEAVINKWLGCYSYGTETMD